MSINGFIQNLTTHWAKPAKGRYISYKEMAAYSVGGVGVNTINSLFGYVALTANCLLVGSVYGIKPTHLAFLSTIMFVLNLIKTPFISMLMDNTNSKYGKFRPYLLYTGVPTVVLLIAMAFIPLSASYSVKCVMLTLIYAFLMIFQSIYSSAFASLAQVLTPNGEERTTLLSVSAFIYNLGPSLVNMLLPILAGLTGGMTNIRTYRILFPIFSIIGVVLGLITFWGTEEKIVVSKDYVARVKFKEGIRQIATNKYFWSLNAYQILGILKHCVAWITAWYCVYAMRNDAALGIINTIMGTASVPGMLLAPLLAKKLGKRNTLIGANLIHAVFSGCMIFGMKSPVLLFTMLYLSTLSIGMDYVIIQSMTADIFDYQQWKTGQRIEGFISQFSTMLIAAFTTLFNLILPFFYEHYGLKTDYTVLYNESVRSPIFNVLIITSVISSLAALIPLLFYDLTDRKQKQMIEDLKARAEEENAKIAASNF